MANKATNCIWYDSGAEDAAKFYAATFPDSSVGEVHRAPGDNPRGKEGAVLTVEFTVCGIPVSASTAARTSSRARRSRS